MENDVDLPIQTLRLGDKEKAKLIWAVQSSPQFNLDMEDGKLSIAPAQAEGSLGLSDKGAACPYFAVLPYRFSRRAVSLIHGRYVHQGSPCKIRLRSLTGEWIERTGKTGACVHVQGLIHTLTITFEEPLNLDDFAPLNAEQETRHLQEIAEEMPEDDGMDSAALIGKVLYVDDQPSDRKLVSHWLSRAGMDVAAVSDGDNASNQIEKNSFDLFIVDIRLLGESGIELIRKTRAANYVEPILAVSADEDDETRAAALAAGANEFLTKPFSSEVLEEAAMRLMGFEAGGDLSPIYSTHSDDVGMVALLTGYTRGLSENIQALREASKTNDYDTIEKIASTLKGCGTSYGYPAITDAATDALATLEHDVRDPEEVRRVTNTLAVVLSRIKMRIPPQDAAPRSESA